MPARSSTPKPTIKKTAPKAAAKKSTKTPINVTAAAKAASGKPAPTKAAATKTTATKTAPAKPAPVKPATVTKLEPVVAGPALRKKELLDTVALKTGIKRAEVKKVVEATLAVMGLALQDSRDLNLQPFGTVKINRERKLPDGKVVVTRIRQARDLPQDDAVAPAPAADSKTAAE